MMRFTSEGEAMLGLGGQEIILLGIIGLPVLVGTIAVVYWASKKKRQEDRDERDDDW